MHQYLYTLYELFLYIVKSRPRPPLGPRLSPPRVTNPHWRAPPLAPLEGAAARATGGRCRSLPGRATSTSSIDPRPRPSPLTRVLDQLLRPAPPTPATGSCSPTEQWRAPLLAHLSPSLYVQQHGRPIRVRPNFLSNPNFSVQFRCPMFLHRSHDL
jgi:hypothetical protein